MKRRVGLLIVLTIVVAACADDADGGRGGLFTSTTTLDTASGFPGAIVDLYLEGCQEEGTRQFCECTIDELERRLTLEEFLQLVDDEDNPIISDVSALCLRDAAPPTTEPVASATTEPDPPPDVPPLNLDQVIALSIDDLRAFWTAELPGAYGVPYEDVSATIPYLPSTGDVPSCGPQPLPLEVYELNAFYCSIDDFVAWDDEVLMPTLFDDFGDFTVALVMAHEWGHAIQERGRVRGDTLLLELQADCFAGAWAGDVSRGNSELLQLQDGDLEEGMAGYLLFRDPPGTSPLDPDAHGNAFDRVTAFFDGVGNGVLHCVGYEDDPPQSVFVPLRPGDDPFRGGDLPLDQVVPELTRVLEEFWTASFPLVFGGQYAPMTDFFGYDPASGISITCGDVTLSGEELAGGAFYCPDGDFVAWDESGFILDLYDEIGDFAVGTVLGHEWANAVQVRAGLPTDGVAASLQADCFAGLWASALMFEDNPFGLVLSAGDVDEVVSLYLRFSDQGGGTPEVGSAFQRLGAFSEGLLSFRDPDLSDGAARCLALGSG